ncbi:MAG: hypothetical protein F6K48_03315 [Okeania sp. SIO3H1]|nr:hypothetical protein [Okeania sp. SIO3H1]
MQSPEQILKDLINAAKVDEVEAFEKALAALDPFLKKEKPQWLKELQHWARQPAVPGYAMVHVTVEQLRSLD